MTVPEAPVSTMAATWMGCGIDAPAVVSACLNAWEGPTIASTIGPTWTKLAICVVNDGKLRADLEGRVVLGGLHLDDLLD